MTPVLPGEDDSTGAGRPPGGTQEAGPGAGPDGAAFTAVQRAALQLLSTSRTTLLLTRTLDACRAEMGCGPGAVYLQQDDGWLRLATHREFPESRRERFRMLSPDAPLPVAESVRHQRPVFARGEQYLERYPDLVELRRPTGLLAFPLLVDDRCLGSLLLMREPAPPSPHQVASLTMLTTVCAHRLEHLLSLGQPAGDDPGDQPRLARDLRLLDSRTRSTRLQLAVSNADIGFYEWDFDSGRTVWDERLCRIFGVDPQRFDERIETFYELLHPEDRQAVERALAEGLDTGRYEATHRVVHPDRTLRWVKAEGRVTLAPDGRPVGMTGVVQDRTAEHQRETRDAARREFMLSVTRGIVGALSTQEVIDTAAATVLPTLGARDLALYVSRRDTLQLVGSHGFGEAELRILQENGRLMAQIPGLVASLVERPRFFETEDALRTFLPHSVPAVPGQRAWALLPVVAGTTTGVCLIAFTEPHTFSEDDRALCQAATGVLAQAVGRAQLLDQQRRQMTELQRMMLPHRIPELPGLELAVRYLPGSEGLQVGGDWYDVVPAGDGRVMLAIGDVQGHSAQAAAVMGHLRVAMQTYASEGMDPAGLLERGNHRLCDLETERFATCTVVEVPAGQDRLRIARGGHPLPMLLSDDGRVDELDVPGGLPLGCFPDYHCPVTGHRLPPGGTLLLYTDGLVEQPGEDYGKAVDALARRLAELTAGDKGRSGRVPDAGPDGGGRAAHPPDLDTLADRIIAPAAARAPRDDVALLLLRRTAGPPGGT